VSWYHSAKREVGWPGSVLRWKKKKSIARPFAQCTVTHTSCTSDRALCAPRLSGARSPIAAKRQGSNQLRGGCRHLVNDRLEVQ